MSADGGHSEYWYTSRVIQSTDLGTPIVTDSLERAESWTDAWVLLGTESVQELVGYTSTRSGRVERYRTVEIERYIHFSFSKRPSAPNRSGVSKKYGEIPPPSG